MTGSLPSTPISRTRWRQPVAAATVVLLLAVAVGCGSDGDGDSIPGGSPGRPERLVVEQVAPVGIGPTASVVSLGSTLIAQGFVWSDEPFQWSDDGIRWQPSEVPSIDREAFSPSIVVLDDVAVVFAGQEYGRRRIDPTSRF